ANQTSTFGGSHAITAPAVRFSQFIPDLKKIGQGVDVLQPGWETVLENNKVSFSQAFVQRSAFTSAYPTSMTPTQFVDALFGKAGIALSEPDHAKAINEFGVATDTSTSTFPSR